MFGTDVEYLCVTTTMITTKYLSCLILRRNLPFLVLLTLLSIGNAQVGSFGNSTISGTNVEVNTRTALTSNVTAGSTQLSVLSSSMTGAGFGSALSAGDLILIIQMQGASIDTTNTSDYGNITAYNNSGNYEFRCIESIVNSTTVVVSIPLSNSYTADGKAQIIRIPRYSNLTVPTGNSISPAAWNGSVGGVTAIEIDSTGEP